MALLLLRLCVGALLFIDQSGRLSWPAPLWLALGSVLVAGAVAVGFLTPLFAVLCGLLELSALTGVAQFAVPLIVIEILLAAVIALLGPGAYSIDALMFGRRVVLLPPER